MKRYLCLYFILMCLISACGSTPTQVAVRPSATAPTSTPPPTATATQQPMPTATFTKTPKPTSTLTATPPPTATPIILPTKQVLMQFGIFGGDGGSALSPYFGRDTPQWVLYTDGQLLFRKSDENGDWVAETTLSIPQMCSLLSHIESTGFFQIQGDGSSEDDPIYTYGGATPLTNGGGGYIIQVNGQPYKGLFIHKYYTPYLSPEAKAAFNLFNQFAAPAKLGLYQPQYALLWIETGKGNLAYARPVPTAQAWPANLPSLESLAENHVETSWSVGGDYHGRISQALIQGKDVQPILNLFDNRLAAKFAATDNGEYYVIARPLLPHEAPMSLSAYPYDAVEFDLPFKCSQ